MQAAQQTTEKLEDTPKVYPRKMLCAYKRQGAHYFMAYGPGEAFCSDKCQRRDPRGTDVMRRRNQPRVLPPLLPEKADNYLWKPDAEERQYFRNERHRKSCLARLERLAERFAKQELEHLRRKCAALQSVVDADRAWLAAQAEREAELKKVEDWWASEREKELAAEDEQRRKRLARATEQINRDTVRREREEFAKRGLIRGRKR